MFISSHSPSPPSSRSLVDNLYGKITEFALSQGAWSIKDLPGCWEAQVDDWWWIAINGHEGDTVCSHGGVVPRECVYIEFLGMPVGVIGPGPGRGFSFTSPLVNEKAIRDALDNAIAEAR